MLKLSFPINIGQKHKYIPFDPPFPHYPHQVEPLFSFQFAPTLNLKCSQPYSQPTSQSPIALPALSDESARARQPHTLAHSYTVLGQYSSTVTHTRSPSFLVLQVLVS